VGEAKRGFSHSFVPALADRKALAGPATDSHDPARGAQRPGNGRKGLAVAHGQGHGADTPKRGCQRARAGVSQLVPLAGGAELLLGFGSRVREAGYAGWQGVFWEVREVWVVLVRPLPFFFDCPLPPLGGGHEGVQGERQKTQKPNLPKPPIVPFGGETGGDGGSGRRSDLPQGGRDGRKGSCLTKGPPPTEKAPEGASQRVLQGMQAKHGLF
jgi:hypothetical protein